jgi:MATE family multidrug resistance protein
VSAPALSHGVGPATFRTLILLAWPVVIARATQSLVGLADSLFVAPLGEAQLAATTTGALDSFALMILPFGVAFIVQSFAAQLAGKGRAADARRYAWYGLAIAGVTLIASLLAQPFVPMAVDALDADPEVRGFMTTYIQLRLLSMGAAVGIEVLGNWYAGLGNTRMQLWTGVFVMVSNVGLDWLLITGNLGAPAWGVAGAAIASSIATWLGFLGLAWCFHAGVGGAPRATGKLGLRWSELRRLVRFGLPNGINWFLEFAAFLFFINIVVVDLGTSSLAALNVVIQINSVSFMPAFGIASAGAILAGQTIGAGRHDDVPHIVRLTMRTTAVWMVGVGLLYLVAPAQLIGLFEPDVRLFDPGSASGISEETLLAVGIVMLQISAAWQLFDACAMTLSEALRSAGDTTWPMLARLGLAWVLFVPGSVIAVMVLDGGAVAAMVCLAAYLAALAGALAWRFQGGAWRKIDLTGVEPVLVED